MTYRRGFEQELQRLQDTLLSLGELVEHNIVEAVKQLQARDFAASQQLIAADREVNKKCHDLEMACLTLIATQQPMAGDLRVIAAIIAITGELERMNDYAKGIARINLMLGEDPLLKPLVDIPRMAVLARDMLHRSLDAFARRDLDLAWAIPADDDEVDALYNQVFQELIEKIIADPQSVNRANYLLWAAHNLERTADRVTNICERVIFMVSGQLVEIGVVD
jgi:phosphate transport system protein